jgi:uncharacterized protein YbaR (Trm112 family)/SAM-dependent methyltransferase
MRKQSLSVLSCPNILTTGRCAGDLEIEVLSQDRDEIIDGFLNCQRCNCKYPIIQGIPILMKDLKQYLTNNFASVSKAIGGAEKINKDLFVYICALTNLSFNQPVQSDYGINDFIRRHYDPIRPKQKLPPFLAPVFKFYRKNNIFEILRKWSQKADKKSSIAIDIGCNVGGHTYLLAERCAFSYGIDLSYPHLFTANCITKNIPYKRNWYKEWKKGKLKTVRMTIKKLDNLDFMVASADNLPFKREVAEFSLLSALIDITGNQAMILKEAGRILRKRGKVLISFIPFLKKINLGAKQVQLTVKNVKGLLKKVVFSNAFYTIRLVTEGSNFSLKEKELCYMSGVKLQ